MGAKIIELIHTDIERRGNGLDDPIRIIEQYWTKDGKLLFEKDSLSESIIDANAFISYLKSNFDEDDVIEDILEYVANHKFRRY